MNKPDFNFLSPEIKKVLSHPEHWKTISSKYSEVPELPQEQWWNYIKESHPLREIMLVVSGSGRGYWFNGRFYPMSTGTMFIIDGNEDHELQLKLCQSDTGSLIYLWFYFWQRNVIMRYLSEKDEVSRDKYVFKLTDGDGFYQRWDELDEALGTPEHADVLSRFKMHLGMAAYQALQEAGSGLRDADFKRDVVNYAKLHISKNIKNGIDGEQLARTMGYSRYYFSRMFKEYSGVTIQEYIDECRKKIFPVLLAKKTGKKEIASALGFRDVHSLYKWQKKLYRKESC